MLSTKQEFFGGWCIYQDGRSTNRCYPSEQEAHAYIKSEKKRAIEKLGEL